MKIHGQIFEGTYVFSSLGFLPRSTVARLYANSKFNFLRNYQTVSKETVPFYIPTSNVGGFQLLHGLSNTYYCPFSSFIHT